MSRKPTDLGFDAIAERFKLLSDPMRLKIIYLLQAGPRSVGEIADALACPQPTASRQLGKLQTGGLLAREREGTTVRYSIADRNTLKLCETVCGSIAKAVDLRSQALFED